MITILVNFNDKNIIGYCWNESQLIIIAPKSPRNDISDMEYFKKFWKIVSNRISTLEELKEYKYLY